MTLSIWIRHLNQMTGPLSRLVLRQKNAMQLCFGFQISNGVRTHTWRLAPVSFSPTSMVLTVSIRNKDPVTNRISLFGYWAEKRQFGFLIAINRFTKIFGSGGWLLRMIGNWLIESQDCRLETRVTIGDIWCHHCEQNKMKVVVSHRPTQLHDQATSKR